MVRSLYTAANGMIGQQSQIDVISNNIANVNTSGYKKQRADFADLMYQVSEYAGTAKSATTVSPTGIEVGLGSKLIAVNRMFGEGNLKQTGNNLDLAINGKGFFQVTLPDGRVGYTRNGTFKLSANGMIVDNMGNPLIPNITIPENTTHVNIGTDGTVSVVLSGANAAQNIGQINLVNFVNPAGLHALGDNLLVQTNASGAPIAGNAGTNGIGTIKQGFLELSNVKLVTELTDLISGQRAYEASSKALVSTDEMLKTVIQLKR